MSDPVSKEIDIVKKEIRDGRKECMNLNRQITKQLRKVNEHEVLFQEFISLSVELENQEKKLKQGKIIEKDQIELISKLQKEITYLRDNFKSICQS